jgi:hypothetical protein
MHKHVTGPIRRRHLHQHALMALTCQPQWKRAHGKCPYKAIATVESTQDHTCKFRVCRHCLKIALKTGLWRKL